MALKSGKKIHCPKNTINIGDIRRYNIAIKEDFWYTEKDSKYFVGYKQKWRS